MADGIRGDAQARDIAEPGLVLRCKLDDRRARLALELLLQHLRALRDRGVLIGRLLGKRGRHLRFGGRSAATRVHSSSLP